MQGNDVVVGRVLKVIDPETISIITTKIGTSNVFNYNEYELVYATVNSTNLPLNKLVGFEVRCYVTYRDINNRLTGTIELA